MFDLYALYNKTIPYFQCRNVMNKFFEFRDEQYELAKVAPPNDAGGYTSVNINKINVSITM